MAEARVDALITNEDEIRIHILGLSRAGITATGNAILGYGAFKATSTSGEKITGVVDGRKVSVIDFPGWFDVFDAMQREDETGQKLFEEEDERCDRLAAPGAHVFLRVIQMGKYTPEEKRLVELMETICGLTFSHCPNGMTIFTHGGDLDLQHCSVEDCWKAFPKLLQAISKCGGDVCCHVFNTEDPSQVTELMEKISQLVMKNGGGYLTKEMQQKQIEMDEENKAMQEELDRIWMELETSEDLKQTCQTLRKRFYEEARKQEMLAAMKQHFGGEQKSLNSKVEQLTVQLGDKERRDVELEKKRERREMQLEKTIHTLQGVMAEARVDALITNEDEIRIQILGLSRAGVTATGNAILGYGAFKATSTSGEKITGVVDGRTVSVIDFPGWFDVFDAMQREDETGQKLFEEEHERCDRLAAPGAHVVLRVIQMGKYTPEEKRLVELMETYVGLFNFSHCPNGMFLFTHGGDLDLQHCSVEDCWKAFPKLLQAISKCGGDVCCHVFNTEDPSQVTELMEKISQLVMKNGGGYLTKEMGQKHLEMNDENKALLEEEDRIEMELNTSEDLKQTYQTLRKRFDEEARKQEMLAAMKQHFGGEQKRLNSKVEQLTVQLGDKERRDVELEKKRERREMQLEKTIHTLQESQQVVHQEIKQLKGELEKSNLQIPSNKVKQITDQLKDKESQLEKINRQIEGAEHKLTSVRVEFIKRLPAANLDSLLDQLLHEGVINDGEMESVKDVKPRAEKARAIIDMVRKKGDEASSKMIRILKKDQNFRELLSK